MNIPFFKYPKIYLDNKNIYLKAINEVCSKGAFIMQKELISFEKKIAAYTKSKHAIGVGNATDGMQIFLMASGLPKGSEILICSHTMIATASAIKLCGYVPVPVEANNYDYMIDIIDLDKKITKKTSAIIVTQLNGRTANMDEINKIKRKYKLRLFEDAAQALGSKFKNKFAGTFGEASVISFYPAKNLGCFGDGGIILTNNTNLYKKMSLIRDHGRNKNNDVEIWGLNSRLDNLQAKILEIKFKDYGKIINHRRRIAKTYQKLLKNNSFISTPPEPSNYPHFDVFQNYEIQAHNRDKLINYLKSKGISTLVQWSGKAIHNFTKLGFKAKLPATDKIFKKILLLPMNQYVSIREAEYVAKAIKNFYLKNNK